MESVIQPKLSICCITYNHGPYIRACLDGILAQKISFGFEVLIHDDASTDDTAEVIREYQRQYPEIIKPIFQCENQFGRVSGMNETFNFPRARGEFIAFCEGDDWWCDPNKIADQILAMENDPQLIISHTAYQNFYQKSGKITECHDGARAVNHCLDAMIIRNSIGTLTVVARSEELRKASEEIKPYASKFQMGDYPLWLLLCQKGGVHYLPRVTANYRVLEESMSHSGNIEKRIGFAKSAYSVSQFMAIRCKRRIARLRSTFCYIKDAHYVYGNILDMSAEVRKIAKAYEGISFVIIIYWRCILVKHFLRKVFRLDCT